MGVAAGPGVPGVAAGRGAPGGVGAAPDGPGAPETAAGSLTGRSSITVAASRGVAGSALPSIIARAAAAMCSGILT